MSSNLFDDSDDDLTPAQLIAKEKEGEYQEPVGIVSESIMNAADAYNDGNTRESDAYGNLQYNFGTFASFFAKFQDLPDVTEYLTTVESLIRELNLTANDIDA